MRRILLIASVFTFCCAYTYAQNDADNMMKMLEEGDGAKSTKKEDVNFTFKATRLINGSTTESLGAGVLDVRIGHRFGKLNQGAENFFGIDNANTRLGLDYGITKYLMIGIGHNVLGKENDGFAKVKILKQQKNGMPISLSYYAGMSIQTMPAPTLPKAGQEYFFSNRLCYFNQVLIARKFNDRISLMLMPSILHCNYGIESTFKNNTIAMGVGGRIKLSNRIAFTGEYYYRLTGADNLSVDGQKTYNSLSLGFDIETGGHVFQLHFTNSPGVSERIMLGQTTDSWSKGELHYGFNISRVFTIVKPKEFKKR